MYSISNATKHKKKLTNYIIDTNSNINKTINSFNAIWKKITKKYKL